MKKSKLFIFGLVAVMILSLASFFGCNNDEGKVTVSFKLNYETSDPAPDSVTVSYGGKYGELPAPSREGWTFAGWYTTPSSDAGKLVTSDSEVTNKYDHRLHARWTGNPVEATLDIGDGTLDYLPIGYREEDGKIKKDFTLGGKYGNLPTPTAAANSGKVFIGWFLSATGGKAVNENTIVTDSEPHSLYARFREPKWDFTDPNDVTFFKRAESSTCSLSFSAEDNGEDGKRLAVYATPESGDVLIQFEFDFPLEPGDVAVFDLDFKYEDGPLTVAPSDENWHVDVNALPRGMEAEVHMAGPNGWDDRTWYSWQNLPTGEAWPGKTHIRYAPRIGGDMCVLLRVNSSLDFNKLTCYLSDLRIVTMDEEKESFDFATEDDLLYFATGNDSRAQQNYAVGKDGDDSFMEITYAPITELGEYWIHFLLNRPLGVGDSVSFDFEVVCEDSEHAPIVVANGKAAETDYGIHVMTYGSDTQNPGNQEWGAGLWWAEAHCTVGEAWNKVQITHTMSEFSAEKTYLNVRISVNAKLDYTKLKFSISNVVVTAAAQ